ncbi:MAG: acetate--CoA ligase [Solirubrobacterales bacterium]|nr:acetate--CoA ligase [Solirubrobacterales bacterium]
MADATDLENELGHLLDQERFSPPEAFAAGARVTGTQLHDAPGQDAPAWWLAQTKEVLDWAKEPTQSLDDSKKPFYEWFADGELNVSHNCLDRHVIAGNGERVAFHWRGEEGEERDVTYAELLADTQRIANALYDRGIRAGDVVGIFLPMIPAAVASMLACARIGAVHNVVFGGFAPESVVERMHFSEAKALITVDGARRKGKTAAIKASLDTVLEREPVPSLEHVFVVRATGIDTPMHEGRDVWMDEAMAAADPECPAEPFPAEQPLFILYSSGSTAKPKGILHSSGGYLTQTAWTFREVFDLKVESDVYFCTADVGWVTGHSYMVYGPLANGATSVMYEGAPDYPHKGIWWELCERYGVTLFYTAPTAIRACMKWGPEHPRKHDLSKLRLLGTVGEPINPKAWLWYHKVVGGERCPIVDTWWQTETGAIMVTTLPGAQDAKPGVAGTPLPGITVRVVSQEGEVCDAGTQGLLAIPEPWPAMLRTLYKDPDRYQETYFSKFGPGTYFVGDAARQDEEGYVSVIGRVDDVINVSGHRLSTAEVESAIVAHPKVAEAAVIGQADEDTGQAIAAFVTLEGDLEGTDALVDELREHVAQRIGKLARPKRIIWSDDLPKTRSGKIMRRLLRDVAEGRALGDVTTLRDPDVMARLEAQIKSGQVPRED